MSCSHAEDNRNSFSLSLSLSLSLFRVARVKFLLVKFRYLEIVSKRVYKLDRSTVPFCIQEIAFRSAADQPRVKAARAAWRSVILT